MSITGQVGHVAIAKQRPGTYNNGWSNVNGTAADYRNVKITGDSLVASNNPLIAENEIGVERDASDAAPGGFSSAGALNGNLRARAAGVFLDAALGNSPVRGTGTGGVTDTFTPTDYLQTFTIEKKIGQASPQTMTLQYQNVMCNTLNITAPAGALSTFSAGVIAAGETRLANSVVPDPPTYTQNSDDLLVFHSARIRLAPYQGTLAQDETFQSIELVVNNNIAADEFTVRPSRFLRSLTEGPRTVEINMTLIFENPDKYSQYTYGLAAGAASSTLPNSPSYQLYQGALDCLLANWQPATADDINSSPLTSPNPPANPQGVQFLLPRLMFTGLPVALTSGRIVVTTTARALKDQSATPQPIVTAYVRPSGAGFNY